MQTSYHSPFELTRRGGRSPLQAPVSNPSYSRGRLEATRSHTCRHIPYMTEQLFALSFTARSLRSDPNLVTFLTHSLSFQYEYIPRRWAVPRADHAASHHTIIITMIISTFIVSMISVSMVTMYSSLTPSMESGC